MRKIGILFANFILIGSMVISTSASVSANETELSNKLPGQNSSQLVNLGRPIEDDAVGFVEMDAITGETTLTISDAELIEELEKLGEDVSSFKNNLLVRGSGVTKVVISGSLSTGNFKVYLSTVMLKAIKLSVAGLSVLKDAISFYFGNYLSAASSAFSAMLNVIKACTITCGVIYTVTAWKYKGKANQ